MFRISASIRLDHCIRRGIEISTYDEKWRYQSVNSTSRLSFDLILDAAAVEEAGTRAPRAKEVAHGFGDRGLKPTSALALFLGILGPAFTVLLARQEPSAQQGGGWHAPRLGLRRRRRGALRSDLKRPLAGRDICKPSDRVHQWSAVLDQGVDRRCDPGRNCMRRPAGASRPHGRSSRAVGQKYIFLVHKRPDRWTPAARSLRAQGIHPVKTTGVSRLDGSIRRLERRCSGGANSRAESHGCAWPDDPTRGDRAVVDDVMGPKLSMRGEAVSPLVIALLSVLVVLAALFLIWPVWRAFLPLEILRSEGFNAYHADMALNAPGLLYPPPSGLIANNYPPLYDFLIGGFARLFGDAVYVGRAISLLATIGLGVAAASIVRQFGGGPIAAIVAGSWFVATMARFYDDYIGTNDPQLLAHLIMAVGLLWFIARYNANRSVEPAVLVMVVAGFFKHNVIAIPVAALVWLALDDWHKGFARGAFRSRCRCSRTGHVRLALEPIFCQRHAFAADLPRRSRSVFYPSHEPVGPCASFVGLWAWLERQSKAARFTMLHVGASFVLFVLQRSAQGIGSNGQFDLVFAIAIGIGLAFDRLPLYVGRRIGWQPARIQLARPCRAPGETHCVVSDGICLCSVQSRLSRACCRSFRGCARGSRSPCSNPQPDRLLELGHLPHGWQGLRLRSF